MTLGRTAIASMLSTASSAVALFITFRAGFMHAGGEFMGLWALISGLLMFARISDTGASISIARLAVIGRNESSIRIGTYLLSGMTVATVPAIVLSSLILIVFGLYFDAHEILGPVVISQVLGSAWIYAIGSSVSGIFSGCLDGIGKMVPRYLASVGANLLLVVFAIFLVPTIGAQGFLIAHILYVVALTIIYALLLFTSGQLLFGPAKEYISVTRASFSFLSKSIFMGTARAGFEPVSKLLVGYFAGLTAVALFDLALRVSSQLRQLANAPLQPIAVLTARTTAALSPEHRPMIEKWMLISIAAGFAVALGQIVSAPVVAWLVIGRVDGFFSTMSAILAISFFINFSGTVAFYVVLASGQLKGLLALHAWMTILNIALGASMGWIWGGIGVIVAWGITLAVGGPVTLGLYLVEHSMSARRGRALVLVFLGGIAILAAVATAVTALQPGIEQFLGSISTSGFSRMDLVACREIERFHA